MNTGRIRRAGLVTGFAFIAFAAVNATATGWTWLRFGTTATDFDRAAWDARRWSEPDGGAFYYNRPRMVHDVLYGHGVCQLSRSEIQALLGEEGTILDLPTVLDPRTVFDPQTVNLKWQTFTIGRPWYRSAPLSLSLHYDGEKVTSCRLK